jgi:hypothetical protein
MKYILLLLIFFLAIPNLYSQTTEPSGKVFTEIFTNFHYNIKDSLGTTGFGIERAFLGYTYVAGNNFSATVILNAGSPDDVADGSEPRRYVHLREAFINYTKDKLSVNRGTRALEQLVDSGKAAVAFSMYPVSVLELMAVSDAGEIMPPKSTWFEPKLRDGLLIHEI